MVTTLDSIVSFEAAKLCGCVFNLHLHIHVILCIEEIVLGVLHKSQYLILAHVGVSREQDHAKGFEALEQVSPGDCAQLSQVLIPGPLGPGAHRPDEQPLRHVVQADVTEHLRVLFDVRPPAAETEALGNRIVPFLNGASLPTIVVALQRKHNIL